MPFGVCTYTHMWVGTHSYLPKLSAYTRVRYSGTTSSGISLCACYPVSGTELCSAGCAEQAERGVASCPANFPL
eukprot:3941634-Rhodomonas_salina.1